ncbi:MAG: hypothetical protein WA030_02940 [Candidatus Microsaccharimonas sp.]
MRIIATSLVALLLGTGVAACTSQPEEYVESHQERYYPNREDWPPPPRVADPWKPGDFQNGIQIYWHYNASDEDIQDKIDNMLDYVVRRHANSVAITFPIYTDGVTPTTVYTDAETPTPAQLSIILAEAKNRNLRVLVRPLIYEMNIVEESPGDWRGSIDVADPSQWFDSYINVLQQYVPVAVQYDVDEFVAGTELVSLQSMTDQWQRVIETIRAAGFAGEVSYSTNWADEENVVFSDIGVDAYPGFELGDDASVDQLTAAISGWFQSRYSADELSRLTIQEAGIPAISGMYLHPWWWGGNDQPLNVDIQAKWFTAMCNAAHNVGVEGIYYWNLDTNIDFNNEAFDPMTGYSASFYGRPAEDNIRECFLR